VTDAAFPERLEKRRALEAAGIPPHALNFDRSATAADLHAAHVDLASGDGSGVAHRVAGRVMLRRDSGQLIFLIVEDATGRIQLFCSRGDMEPSSWSLLDHIDLGDWVGGAGEVIRTKRGELSIKATELTMLTKSLRPLPDKWHGLADVERRYRQRYLDLAVNEEAREVMRVRSRALSAVRAEFEARDFLEVETPVLQPLYGGALARPFVTHHNAFDIDLYLRIAPELYLKRLVVGGVERVLEVARNFRNEGVSSKHNPELPMVEAYQAVTDYHRMIELWEALFAAAGASGRLRPPWPRARMVELVSDAVGSEVSLDVPADELRRRVAAAGVHLEAGWTPGKVILEAYEKLVEGRITDPTIVMDWPRDVSPLARAHRDDPRYAEQFDVVIDGREMGSAYSELTDALEQRRLFEEQARLRAAGDEEAMGVDEDFVRALEHGLPPCGGLGFGLDRLAMSLVGVDSIREVILFPLLRPEA